MRLSSVMGHVAKEVLEGSPRRQLRRAVGWGWVALPPVRGGQAGTGRAPRVLDLVSLRFGGYFNCFP